MLKVLIYLYRVDSIVCYIIFYFVKYIVLILLITQQCIILA